MGIQNLKSLTCALVLMILLCADLSFAQQHLLPYKMNIYDHTASKGYYFLFTYRMRKEAATKINQQMIIDGSGHTVYYRLCENASDFKIHSNGVMSYCDKEQFILLDHLFNKIDSVKCINGIETDSHDFQILPNGNYLLIGMESFDEDLSKYPVFMQKNLPGSKKGKVKYGVVQELDKNKKLIWEWRSKNHFKIEDASRIYLNDTTKLDVTHFNSVEMDKAGNIIVSARYFNEVFKINKKDGSLIWRMGGPYNNVKFMNDTIPFLGQHDARMQPNGNLTLFDNGYGDVKHNVRALEYEINDLDRTAKLVWSYSHNKQIISEATGNMQRLTNGNTLINYGKVAGGSPNITFEEVNTKGETIMQLSFADTIGTYRAFHYPTLPFKLKQPELEVYSKNGVSYLKAKNKYTSYKWSTGETTREIKMDKKGLYYLYVPIGNGGFISSEVKYFDRGCEEQTH